jgi:hypothetical protein
MPNLTQLTTVKDRLGIDSFDLQDDAALALFIGFVSGRFVQECSRDFDRQAGTTQEFEGQQCELVLNRYPIEAVTAFHLKGNETDGWVQQTDVDYLIKASARGIPCIVSLDGPLGIWSERLRVTYTGGYVLPGGTVAAGQTALPVELDKACAEQVAHWWQRRAQLGLTSISGEGGVINQFGKLDLLPHVAAMLKPYERWQL